MAFTFNGKNVLCEGDPLPVDAPEAPGDPSGLGVSYSTPAFADGKYTTTATVTWSAASNLVNWVGYTLSYWETGSSAVTELLSSATGSTATIIIPGLKLATGYNFKVRANGTGLNSAWTSTVTQTSGNHTHTPTTPATPIVQAGLRNVTITWAKHGDTDIALYELSVSYDGGTNYSVIWSGINTVYTSTVGAGVQTCHARVRVTDANGNVSAYSAVANDTLKQATDLEVVNAPSGYNLFVNSDFDNALDGWTTTTGTGSAVLAPAGTVGSGAYMAQNTAGAAWRFRNSKLFPISTQRTYILEYFVYDVAQVSGNHAVGVQQWSADRNKLSINSSTDPSFTAKYTGSSDDVLSGDPANNTFTLKRRVFGYGTNYPLDINCRYITVDVWLNTAGAANVQHAVQGVRLREVLESVWINDAAITTAKIGNLQVQNQHIADLTASKLTFTDQSNGHVKLGKTIATDATTAGFWIGNNGGVPTLNVGDANSGIKFDNTGTEIAGKVTIKAGSSGIGNLGYTGALDATRNVHRGAWATSTAYILGDEVTYLGSTWACVSAHTSSAINYPTDVSVLWSIRAAKGADGVGTPAQYVIVTGEQAFKYTTGATTPVSTSIVLTAALFGGLTTYDWEYWTGTAWANLSGTQNTATYTLYYNNGAWSGNTLRVRCLSGTAYDETTIVKLYDGAQGGTGPAGLGAITVVMNNRAHTVPTASDGTNGTYTGSGTSIRVYEGTTELVYHATGLVAGTYTVIAAGTNITPGGLTGIGSYATAGVATAMTQDTAYITFTISGTRSGGLAIASFTELQTFSKAKAGVAGSNGTNAKTVSLTANAYVIPYDGTGAEVGSTTITLTATPLNHSGTVYYEFLKNGNAVVNSTTATYVVPTKPAANATDVYSVNTREGSASGSVIAYDNLSVLGVKGGATGAAGASAYTVVLTNDAHTLPTTTAGTVTYTGSGTQVIVFKGATELNSVASAPTTGQFSVSASCTTGTITPSTPTYAGNPYVYPDHSGMTTDNAIITYTINLEGSVSVTKLQSLAKSKQGATGEAGVTSIVGYLTNESDTVATASDGSGGSYSSSGGAFKVYSGITDVTTSSAFSVASSSGVSISIGASTGIYTIASMSAATGTATLRAVYSGVTIDKIYSISQSRAGATGSASTVPGPAGPALVLTASRQTFTATDGALDGSQTDITFTAVRQNVTGTAAFSTSPTVTLTGTGDTRTLSSANFGANKYVAVTCTVGSLSDIVTVVRLEKSTAAAGADVTNYSDSRISNTGITIDANGLIQGIGSGAGASIVNNMLQNNVLTIPSPRGAAYQYTGGAITGAIKITLPKSWTNTMLKMTVDVYLHTGSGSFSLDVGGYTYAALSTWAAYFAQLKGSKASNNMVKFGHDGTYCCIVIGDTTSVWPYPNITVKNFQAGYSGQTEANWAYGWEISIISTVTGITFSGTISDSLLDAKSILNQGALATSSLLENQVDNSIVQAQLDVMVNDNILDKAEKIRTRVYLGELYSEKEKLKEAANALGLSAAATTLDLAYGTLSDYLTVTCALNATSDTSISGATFKTNFATYATAKEVCRKAISDKTATLSTWDGTTNINLSGNLLRNGSFESDVSNYTAGVYESTEGHNTNGCLKVTGATIFYSSDMIPVSPNQSYRVSGWVKGVNSPMLYMGVAGYDSTGSFIPFHESAWEAEGVLAADLVSGATYADLVSTTGWASSSAAVHLRYLGVPRAGYDVKLRSTPLPYNSISGNRITLSAAYSGVTIKAGSVVVNNRGGSGYNYTAAAGVTLGNNWTYYEGTLSPLSATDTQWSLSEAQLRPGVAGIKFLALANYTGTPTQTTYFDDLRIEPVTPPVSQYGYTGDLNATYGATSAQIAELIAATNAISDIASDSKFTPVEKSAVRTQFYSFLSEKDALVASADTAAVTTEKTAYLIGLNALGTYLNNGTTWTPAVVATSSTIPSWIADANLSVTTDITASAFRNRFSTFFTFRQALLNKIAANAALTATWPGLGATVPSTITSLASQQVSNILNSEQTLLSIIGKLADGSTGPIFGVNPDIGVGAEKIYCNALVAGDIIASTLTGKKIQTGPDVGEVGSPGVVMDSTGLRAHKSDTTKTFELDAATGAASFSGSITGGSITGTTITGTTITGNLIQTGDSGTKRVAIYPSSYPENPDVAGELHIYSDIGRGVEDVGGIGLYNNADRFLAVFGVPDYGAITAVLGQAYSGTGIHGWSNIGTGVYGYTSAGAQGVYGVSAGNGVGVRGQSTYSAGVAGSSVNKADVICLNGKSGFCRIYDYPIMLPSASEVCGGDPSVTVMAFRRNSNGYIYSVYTARIGTTWGWVTYSGNPWAEGSTP